ncbi:hypothetical protein, partial [Streptomyces lancefieldiae]
MNNDGAQNDESNDYFGMELLYNTVDSGLGNTGLYDGNISAIRWKGLGDGSGVVGQKGYAFTYDKDNKLKAAIYKVKTATGTTEVNNLNESLTYDHNGNILTLVRNERMHKLLGGATVAFTPKMIDNMTYT